MANSSQTPGGSVEDWGYNVDIYSMTRLHCLTSAVTALVKRGRVMNGNDGVLTCAVGVNAATSVQLCAH